MVAAGYAQLEARRQEVNDLNVFPVADGDTGDNMAQTLRSVMAELDRLNGQMVDDIGRDEIVQAVARAALLGARGNSGVILSQIVRGAAEELASRPGELVDPVLMSAALARAADAAYASVRDPAEGTMITVVREMAHRVATELAHMKRPRLVLLFVGGILIEARPLHVGQLGGYPVRHLTDDRDHRPLCGVAHGRVRGVGGARKRG